MSVNETGHVSILEFGAIKLQIQKLKVTCQIEAYDYGQKKQLKSNQTIKFDAAEIFSFPIRQNPFFFSNSTGKIQIVFDRSNSI